MQKNKVNSVSNQSIFSISSSFDSTVCFRCEHIFEDRVCFYQFRKWQFNISKYKLCTTPFFYWQ
jgi:hypothetical protein